MTPDLTRCLLCPRLCGVDRTAGQRGRCGAGVAARVARAALHFWEEPCVSGSKGAGTVFFSHCPLGCPYCQNAAVSRDGAGRDLTPAQLARVFLSLEQTGAHNLELVTPTHVLPPVLEALALARRAGLSLPVIYNCGGYELPETMGALAGAVDVYLPDFKYADGRHAARYSGAPDYPERALAAIDAMLAQTGPPVFDDDGLLVRGVLVRHLLLPGLLADSLRAVELLYGRYGDNILLSLMSQYTPMGGGGDFPELARRVNPRHYEALVDRAAALGVTRCYVQHPSSAGADFIPAFGGEGLPD